MRGKADESVNRYACGGRGEWMGGGEGRGEREARGKVSVLCMGKGSEGKKSVLCMWKEEKGNRWMAGRKGKTPRGNECLG